VELNFLPNQSLATSTLLTFTDLELSEGEDGPVGRYLNLPAPLQTVVFVMRDASGVIEIPISLHVNEGSLSPLEVSRLAITQLSKMIIEAVAKSPFRMLNSVGAVVFGEPEENQPVMESHALAFESGAMELTARGRTLLLNLSQRMQEDPTLDLVLHHELGQKDVNLLSDRVNPPEILTRRLIEFWQGQRAELVREQKSRLERARVSLLLESDEQVVAQREVLQALYARIAGIDRSLEQTLELLPPRAPHRDARRIRQAAQSLAEARLHAVILELENHGVDNLEERVRSKRPRFESDPAHELAEVRLELRGARSS
jgi:hypothetical protein